MLRCARPRCSVLLMRSETPSKPSCRPPSFDEVTAHYDGQLSVCDLIDKTLRLTPNQQRDLRAYREAVRLLREGHVNSQSKESP